MQVQRLREHIQKKHPEDDVEESSSEQQPDTLASKPGTGAGQKQVLGRPRPADRTQHLCIILRLTWVHHEEGRRDIWCS